jgi:hypothetical protein
LSSQELQRVPLALLSGANDVVPVCTKMNMLERKMEEMVETVTRFTKGQVISSAQPPFPSVTGVGPIRPFAGILQAQVAGGLGGVHPLATPERSRTGSLTGSFAAAAANGLKRKHGESVSAGALGGQAGVVQPGAGAGGGGGSETGLPCGEGGGGTPGGRRPPRVQRKQCYVASKIVATGGRADWVAPVKVFISNTSPDITDADVKEILKMCAEDNKTSE